MNRSKMLNMLVRLATIDNELDGKESKWIMQLGSSLGLSDEEIAEAFKQQDTPPVLNTMPAEDRFDYLYNLIQLMKIDGKVFLSEIDYCERMAEKLGYKASVVRTLSTHIYSDPAITPDRQMLVEKANKHLK